MSFYCGGFSTRSTDTSVVIPRVSSPSPKPPIEEGLDFCKISFCKIQRSRSLLNLFNPFGGPRLLVAEPVTAIAEKSPVSSTNSSQELAQGWGSVFQSSEAASKQENPFQKVLLKVFANEEVAPQDLEMSVGDQRILAAFIQRKFGLRVQNEKVDLLELVHSLRNFPSKKRKEENRKFVFKRVTKLLRGKFTQSARLTRKVEKRRVDEGFYQHYFEQTAAAMNVPICEFYLPGSCTNKAGSNKTFTDGYINLIKASDLFRKDFEEELQELVNSDIKRMVRNKASKIFTKIEALRAQHGEERVINYLLNDKKGKLPWTLNEITTALRCVLASFNLKHPALDQY